MPAFFSIKLSNKIKFSGKKSIDATEQGMNAKATVQFSKQNFLQISSNTNTQDFIPITRNSTGESINSLPANLSKFKGGQESANFSPSKPLQDSLNNQIKKNLQVAKGLIEFGNKLQGQFNLPTNNGQDSTNGNNF